MIISVAKMQVFQKKNRKKIKIDFRCNFEHFFVRITAFLRFLRNLGGVKYPGVSAASCFEISIPHFQNSIEYALLKCVIFTNVSNMFKQLHLWVTTVLM